MMRRRPLFTALTFLFAATAAVLLFSRQAQLDANRSSAYGRLSQLRLALATYEDLHGSLPPQTLRDWQGAPAYSWLAAVLPHCEQQAVFDQLDHTKSWESADNVAALLLGGPFWDWFGRDGYFPCSLKGDESIWNPQTGAPRGLLKQFPGSIVLIAVRVDGVHPLQPFAIDDQALWQALEQGRDALFIDSDGMYGTVRAEGGNIKFLPAIRRDRTNSSSGIAGQMSSDFHLGRPRPDEPSRDAATLR